MTRKSKGDAIHGWVILDKPVGMTSTRAVGAVKRIFNARKAGHGGTLDPLASGLLPIALGEATKTAQYVVEGAKVYRFTVRWGEGTDTDDAEGRVVSASDRRPERHEILSALPRFIGVITQIPPRYSAIKVDGERAYDLAREGAPLELAPREVDIVSLELLECPDPQHAVFHAVCGKGAYVRALARDLGEALGCFGHVAALRRTAVAPFAEADMISLEVLEDIRHKDAGREALLQFLRPIETALDDIPALAVSRAEAACLKRGQPVVLRGRDAPILHGIVLVRSHEEPVALVEAEQGALKPRRVFNLN